MAEARDRTLVRLSDTAFTVKDPSEDIRGLTVIDRHGEEIGHVDDLMLDKAEQRVRFIQVAAGGFLGLGERKFLVPVDAITRIHDDHVHVDQAREHVVGAPEYDPEVTREDAYYESLYGHYGYSPFWAPGYVYPPYPIYRGMA